MKQGQHRRIDLNSDQDIMCSPTHLRTEESLVSVKNISKKFCRNLRRSMAYGIADLSKNLLGLKPQTDTLRQHEFWALENVSFDVQQGETLGIIGVNGSGKSTLLRMLSGIFPPDSGELVVRGKVGALVAVGAGFHPHMTGRENIYLNGIILGMTRKEVQEKLESIVAFSEIGDFLDAPVSTYSSGMRVRLGFSIAIHGNPDILLVDEILSVGDLSFRNKSLRRMHEYAEKARAIIFVSHNLEHIRVLCSRVIILNNGKIEYDGDTHEGCAKYQEMSRTMRSEKFTTEQTQQLDSRFRLRYSSGDDIEILDFCVLDRHHQKTTSVGMNEPLVITALFKAKQEIQDVYFSAAIINERETPCIILKSNNYNKVRFPPIKKGNYRLQIEIPEHHLVPNVYRPQLSIRNSITGETYERIWPNLSFRVSTDGNTLERGIIAVKEHWTLQHIS